MSFFWVHGEWIVAQNKQIVRDSQALFVPCYDSLHMNPEKRHSFLNFFFQNWSFSGFILILMSIVAMITWHHNITIRRTIQRRWNTLIEKCSVQFTNMQKKSWVKSHWTLWIDTMYRYYCFKCSRVKKVFLDFC